MHSKLDGCLPFESQIRDFRLVRVEGYNRQKGLVCFVHKDTIFESPKLKQKNRCDISFPLIKILIASAYTGCTFMSNQS